MHTPSRPTPAVDLELFSRAVDHPELPDRLWSELRKLIGDIAVVDETPTIRIQTAGLARLSAPHLAWFRPTRPDLAAKLGEVVCTSDLEIQWVDNLAVAVLDGRFDPTTAPGQLATRATGEAVLDWLTLNAGDADDADAGDDGTYDRMVDMLEEAEEAAAIDRLTGLDLARVVLATYVMLGALKVARWARLERLVPELAKTDNGETK